VPIGVPNMLLADLVEQHLALMAGAIAQPRRLSPTLHCHHTLECQTFVFGICAWWPRHEPRCMNQANSCYRSHAHGDWGAHPDASTSVFRHAHFLQRQRAVDCPLSLQCGRRLTRMRSGTDASQPKRNGQLTQEREQQSTHCKLKVNAYACNRVQVPFALHVHASTALRTVA
jgi:hypothetical protein